MIDEYSYLWDGSEPGWCLVCLGAPLIRVFVTFPSAPSIAEVAAIRKLCPELGALGTGDVYRRVRGVSRVDLGVRAQDEANEYLERGRTLGLTVVPEEQPLRYAIVNSKSRHFLLIEDNDISAEVKRVMLHHGVSVVTSESLAEPSKEVLG